MSYPIDLNDLAQRINKNARDHGFWSTDNYPTFGDKIALVHSELSESLEEYRDHKAWYYEVDGKPEGIGVELADAIIRILDMCEEMAPQGFNIQQAILNKMSYNETRSFMHGGKAL